MDYYELELAPVTDASHRWDQLMARLREAQSVELLRYVRVDGTEGVIVRVWNGVRPDRTNARPPVGGCTEEHWSEDGDVDVDVDDGEAFAG